MWAQAGFRPDDFWHQTPLHLQLVMRGVRKRLEQEAESRSAQAYETGAFGGLAHHGKLKAFSHYRGENTKARTPQEMLKMLQSMGSGSNMKIKRVKIAND